MSSPRRLDAPPSMSLTESAYGALRADLLACRLLPGQKLKIHELCLRLSVSPSAVRESLSRLSAEGLVVSEAQKGFRVAPVSVEDLDDLTEARIEIETICLRRAIANGGIEWETRLVAAYHRLSRTPERAAGEDQGFSDQWSEADAEFHLALVEACNSAWLLRLRAILHEQSGRYCRLSATAGSDKRDLVTEHREIYEPAMARDADRTCQAIARHFTETARLVRELAPQLLGTPSKDLNIVRRGRFAAV